MAARGEVPRTSEKRPSEQADGPGPVLDSDQRLARFGLSGRLGRLERLGWLGRLVVPAYCAGRTGPRATVRDGSCKSCQRLQGGRVDSCRRRLRHGPGPQALGAPRARAHGRPPDLVNLAGEALIRACFVFRVFLSLAPGRDGLLSRRHWQRDCMSSCSESPGHVKQVEYPLD